jgi:GT2 family glycosyltransferase
MISIVVVSKDERLLDSTLDALESHGAAMAAEIVVVDASQGRLDAIRRSHPSVRWIDFTPPPAVRISIAHQRNVGVAAAGGDIIVFTDAGCFPQGEWLRQLVAPLESGSESVVAGLVTAPSGPGPYDYSRWIESPGYLRECATGNMALTRAAFDAVGGFDERFEYGSDVDMSWRLIDAGYRVRYLPSAVIAHDFGTHQRQLRRWYVYGQARARLYRTHPDRLWRVLRDDPVAVFYPLFLLGLPLAVRFRWYPALVLVPAWRNRRRGAVRATVANLAYGLGVLREVVAATGKRVATSVSPADRVDVEDADVAAPAAAEWSEARFLRALRIGGSLPPLEEIRPRRRWMPQDR